MRPFVEVAGIGCRGYSRVLQRAIVDFGADVPFWRVSEKVREHYRLDIPLNAARRITQGHGLAVTLAEILPRAREDGAPGTLVAQIDGSMIPIVDTGIPAGVDPGTVPGDGRKRRRVR